MAIGAYFQPTSMTTQQYEDILSRLAAAGAGPGAGAARGRLYHICFGNAPKLQVFDIWDSQQSLDAFAQILMPILGEMGMEVGPPMIEPVYKTITA